MLLRQTIECRDAGEESDVSKGKEIWRGSKKPTRTLGETRKRQTDKDDTKQGDLGMICCEGTEEMGSNRAEHGGETERRWQPSIHHSQPDTNTHVKQLSPGLRKKAINHQHTCSMKNSSSYKMQI